MKDAASEKKKQTTGATSSGVSPERNFSKIGLSKFVTAAPILVRVWSKSTAARTQSWRASEPSVYFALIRCSLLVDVRWYSAGSRGPTPQAVGGRKSASNLAKAAGASRGAKWPTSGMMWSCAPEISRAICSACDGGSA